MPLAEVGGQKMQARVFRQLKQRRVAEQVLFVVVLQEAGARQLAIGKPHEAARSADGKSESVTAQDPIANIEANEGQQLGGRCIELGGRTVVAVPIET